MFSIKNVAAGGIIISIDTPQTATFIICNKLGLHARASARLVACTSSFKSEIHFIKGTIKVNAKSILGVMMLAAAQGSELSVEALGADANQALATIGELIANRFGEEQ
ncbi:MAG: HPr family phosphocarrier protein [Mariprofundales bacterium]